MDAKLLERMKKLMKNCKTVEDNYDCKKCRDFGYVFEKNSHNCEVAIPCECLGKKQSLEKLEKCGLSEAFKEKTFSSYECAKKYQIKARHQALKFCNDFVDNNSSLLICGRPGSGKTHLGIAAMLNLINQNVGCRYVEYNSMMMNLKQCVTDEENFIREMDKYLNPRVLFIDDFLKGKITAADLNYIYRIINSRYLKNMPLIISTEKTMDEIISWDEAVGSRLVEMAKDNIITFNERSNNYRLKNYTHLYNA